MNPNCSMAVLSRLMFASGLLGADGPYEANFEVLFCHLCPGHACSCLISNNTGQFCSRYGCLQIRHLRK